MSNGTEVTKITTTTTSTPDSELSERSKDLINSTMFFGTCIGSCIAFCLVSSAESFLRHRFTNKLRDTGNERLATVLEKGLCKENDVVVCKVSYKFTTHLGTVLVQNQLINASVWNRLNRGTQVAVVYVHDSPDLCQLKDQQIFDEQKRPERFVATLCSLICSTLGLAMFALGMQDPSWSSLTMPTRHQIGIVFIGSVGSFACCLSFGSLKACLVRYVSVNPFGGTVEILTSRHTEERVPLRGP